MAGGGEPVWAGMHGRSWRFVRNADFNAEDAEGTEESYTPGTLIVWAADGLEESRGRGWPATVCLSRLGGMNS